MTASIFIIAHAPLASALKNCAMHVYSCDKRVQERIIAVDVEPDANVSVISEEVAKRIDVTNQSETLVLTDLVGATPSNIAESLTSRPDVIVATGINLPMVLTAVCHLDEPFEDIVNLVIEAGKKSITRIPPA